MNSMTLITQKYTSYCPHVCLIGTLYEEDLNELALNAKCDKCDINDKLWLCLNEDCLKIGCGNKGNKHSTQHTLSEFHPLMINLTNRNVWCEVCSSEIKLETNNPSFKFLSKSNSLLNESNYKMDQDNLITMNNNDELTRLLDNDTFGSQNFTHEYDRCNVKGVLGLLNIGNTCYLNSALQALSNCPALTNYFIECSDFVSSTNKEPRISHSYLELIKKLWSSKKSSHIVPTDILQSIKCVNPMFKGYMQQDSQEFLLCLIDQLHEELKIISNNDEDENDNQTSGGLIMKEPSSDTDSYETCDTSNSSSESSITGNSSDSGVDCLNTNKSNELNEDLPLLKKLKETKNKPQEPQQHQQKLKQYSSIISDLFHGKLISQVQCLKCESISKTIETIQDLSLPIPTKEYIQSLQNRIMKRQATSNDSCVVSVTYQSWFTWIMGYIKNFTSWSGTQIQLQDCLNAYFSEADLKGDNMYNCEKCKELNDGIKYSKILSLPETLVIHLKRFRHDFLFSNKINTYVSFPLYDLDLKDYIHSDYENSDESSLYDLCGVICHHGNSSAGGHYTCYALNATNYEWYEYDDSYCKQVDASQVASCQAYVLFYRKKNEQKDFIRDELRRLLSKNKDEISQRPYFISKQWLNKFKHFSKPGEVSNKDIICSHNAVYPHLWPHINKLIVPVTSFVWDYFTQKFGIEKHAQLNHLEPCKQCLINQELLNKRMLNEKNTFYQLNNKKTDDFIHDTATFALSTIWFKKWEAFVSGKEVDPPGQIVNQSICTAKNGFFILNMNSNYRELSEEAWSFLFDIYGGGPVLPIKYQNGHLKHLKNTSLNKTHSLNQFKLASPNLSPRALPTKTNNFIQTSQTSAESLMQVQETRI